MSVHQYAINIDNISYEQLNILGSAVSKERRKKAMKYKKLENQASCIIGEVLIRYALNEIHKLDWKDVA